MRRSDWRFLRPYLWAATALLVMARTVGATELPDRFFESIIFADLDAPTSVAFAADGRVFVAEKSGLIKVFPSLQVGTPSVFADLRTNVHNFWDRGLLSIALHPDFPHTPYVYALYTLDAEPGGTPPRWGVPGVSSDGCPSPPGATTNGCVVGGRLSRLRAAGDAAVEEVPLLEGWCQQFPSHSMGDLVFGADGALYVSAGEGANFFGGLDYGQYGTPVNPCGDPPAGVGGTQTPPGAEGGALRSQSLRRVAGEPAVFSGAVLRLNPLTGAAMPDNPLASSARPNADRIIAYGLRNPFRMSARPGTNELWVGDVGWSYWEEINRIADTRDATTENFGWPCFEGGERNGLADAANVNLCESLYGAPNTVTQARFAYAHNVPVVPGENCETEAGAAVSALQFYGGSSFPERYAGALFFGDVTRRCLWVAPRGADGTPDFAAKQVFVSAGGTPVDLEVGPGGDLYYVDFYGGTLRRIRYHPINQPPTARIVVDASSGPVPLTVHLDASSSSDPNPDDVLSFAWDLDADGLFDDGTDATAEVVYRQAGSHVVRLRVSDAVGETSTAQVTLSASNSAPVARIINPSQSATWRVGQWLFFSGIATDPEDGFLAPSRLSWSIRLLHCDVECHAHPLLSAAGVSSGIFYAPDHEYPSFIEVTLTATDSGGLVSHETVLMQPASVSLRFESSPPGLLLLVGGSAFAAPQGRRAIVGSRLHFEAPSPQGLGDQEYVFSGWSDGGAAARDLDVPGVDSTLVAIFEPVAACTTAAQQCAVGGRAAGMITYFGNQAPLAGALVALRGSSTWLAQTDARGVFVSPDVRCDPCQVVPKAIDLAPSGALSALDAVHALQGAVGLRAMDAESRLACDANGDGLLTAIDAALIMQKRVGLIAQLPAVQRCGSEWLFVPAAEPSADRAPISPHVDATRCDPGLIELPLRGLTSQVDFHAILIGDCNGSWQP